MTEAYVDSFVYSLGDRKVLASESEAAGRLVSTAEDLESAGFRWHHVCSPATTSYDLARDAIAQLAGTGRLGAIDSIVYATCLPANSGADNLLEWERTRDVKYLMDFPACRLQADFGLDQAVVFGLSQQACTGMLGSVRLARAMLQGEEGWNRILCVTADRFPAGALYEQAYNLISDGAAACVVSREPAAFRLVAAHQITNGGLGLASDDETVGTYFAYTHRLFRETLARARLSAADLDWVVSQNTHGTAWQILGRLLGLAPEKVFLGSMPRVGHVISADNIVNLAELLAMGRVLPGHLIALVMAGYGLHWQCVLLEATEAVTA